MLHIPWDNFFSSHLKLSKLFVTLKVPWQNFFSEDLMILHRIQYMNHFSNSQTTCTLTIFSWIFDNMHTLTWLRLISIAFGLYVIYLSVFEHQPHNQQEEPNLSWSNFSVKSTFLGFEFCQCRGGLSGKSLLVLTKNVKIVLKILNNPLPICSICF